MMCRKTQFLNSVVLAAFVLMMMDGVLAAPALSAQKIVTEAEKTEKPIEPAPLPALVWRDAQRQEMAVIFSEAGRHGLNPDLYHAAKIQAELDKPETGRRADLDSFILESALLYARDISGPRVRMADLGLRASDWRRPLEIASVELALRAAPDPAAYLESLAPQTPLYRALLIEAAALVEKIKAGEGKKAVFPLTQVRRTIHPGDRHAVIPGLRGVLGGKLAEGADPNLYDDALAQTVMAFQRNHGLREDGVIGPKTVRFFNQTNLARYQQVIANLERLRWLDPVKPEKYIVVNIPAATLWAIEKDQVVTEMPVIVGRTKRPTPQFKTNVQGIRFNPTWTVPERIKKEDFLPELRKDAAFLSTKGVELWKKDPESGESVRIDPLYVDWSQVTEADLYAYRMVQPSGRSNALGKIRVIMPNLHDVYLHDTNTPEYFRDDDRDISSGCVRLSRPVEIARFVLSGEKNWNEEKMARALESEGTRDIVLANRFPVILLYQTAWLKKGGELVLSYDLYQEDIKLYRFLERAGVLPKLSS